MIQEKGSVRLRVILLNTQMLYFMLRVLCLRVIQVHKMVIGNSELIVYDQFHLRNIGLLFQLRRKLNLKNIQSMITKKKFKRKK